MRKKSSNGDGLTTEARLHGPIPMESGETTRYGTRGKAVVGSPSFQRPAFTDPWSGQTFPWTPYTNLEERQVIIMPRFCWGVVDELKGINLRGVTQDSNVTDLDVFLGAIDWFWEDIYSRLAFKSLQSGKRIATTQLTDPTNVRYLLERWLAVAMGIYGLKSLYDANPVIPAVATWKKAVLETAGAAEAQIDLIFDLIHTFPVPQAFVDLAHYYGCGAAADTTGPVFIQLPFKPNSSTIDSVLPLLATGNGSQGVIPYINWLRLMFESLTGKLDSKADDWNTWQILSLMYPQPVARATTWRTDPEAVRLILSESVIRALDDVSWCANPQEDADSKLPILIPIHGKSPFAATLYRPQFMTGPGIATPDWSWGNLSSLPWECEVTFLSKRESRLLILPNSPLNAAPEWDLPDGSINANSGSSAWSQFLWGPPTIDDHTLTSTQILQHHRFQDESIAYISRQDLVLNTVALLEKFFMGARDLSPRK